MKSGPLGMTALLIVVGESSFAVAYVCSLYMMDNHVRALTKTNKHAMNIHVLVNILIIVPILHWNNIYLSSIKYITIIYYIEDIFTISSAYRSLIQVLSHQHSKVKYPNIL